MQRQLPDTTKYIDLLEELSTKSSLTGDSREFHTAFVKLFQNYDESLFEENSNRLGRILQYIYEKNEEILKSSFSSVVAADSIVENAKTFLSEKIKDIARQNATEVSSMTAVIKSDIETKLSDFIKELNKEIESFKLAQKAENKTQPTTDETASSSESEDVYTSKFNDLFVRTQKRIIDKAEDFYVRYKSMCANQIKFMRSIKTVPARTAPTKPSIVAPVPQTTQQQQAQSSDSIKAKTDREFQARVAAEEDKQRKNLINDAMNFSTRAIPGKGGIAGFLKQHKVFAAIVTMPFVVFELGKRAVGKIFTGVFSIVGKAAKSLILRPLGILTKVLITIPKILLGGILGGLTGIANGFKSIAGLTKKIGKKLFDFGWPMIGKAISKLIFSPIGLFGLGFIVGLIYRGVVKAFDMGKDWWVDFALDEINKVDEKVSEWLKPLTDGYKKTVEGLKKIYYESGLKDLVEGVTVFVNWLLEDSRYMRIFHALSSTFKNLNSPEIRFMRTTSKGLQTAVSVGRTAQMFAKAGTAARLAKGIPYVSVAASLLDVGAQAIVIGSAAMAYTHNPMRTKKGGITIKQRFKSMYGTDLSSRKDVVKRIESQFNTGGYNLTEEDRKNLNDFYIELMEEIDLVSSLQSELSHISDLYDEANAEHQWNEARIDTRRPSILFGDLVQNILTSRLFTDKSNPKAFWTFWNPVDFSSTLTTYKSQINSLGRILHLRSQFLSDISDLFVHEQVGKLLPLIKNRNKARQLAGSFAIQANNAIYGNAAFSTNDSNRKTDAAQDDDDEEIKEQMERALSGIRSVTANLQTDTSIHLPTMDFLSKMGATGAKPQVSQAALIKAIQEQYSNTRDDGGNQYLKIEALRNLFEKYGGNAIADDKGKLEKFLSSGIYAEVFDVERDTYASSGTTFLKFKENANENAKRIVFLRFVTLLIDEFYKRYSRVALQKAKNRDNGKDQSYVKNVNKFLKELEDKLKEFKRTYLTNNNDSAWVGLEKYTQNGNAALPVAKSIFEEKYNETKQNLDKLNLDSSKIDKDLETYLEYDFADIDKYLSTIADTQPDIKAALTIALTILEKKGAASE